MIRVLVGWWRWETSPKIEVGIANPVCSLTLNRCTTKPRSLWKSLKFTQRKQNIAFLSLLFATSIVIQSHISSIKILISYLEMRAIITNAFPGFPYYIFFINWNKANYAWPNLKNGILSEYDIFNNAFWKVAQFILVCIHKWLQTRLAYRNTFYPIFYSRVLLYFVIWYILC